MIGLVAAVSISGALAELPRLQDIPPLPAIHREPQITYLDRSGQVIGVRGGRYAPPVDIGRLPAHIPAAFIAIEDRRFYTHAGLDPMGIARALVADIADGKRQGASTITQQTVKNVFLTADQTVERKAREAVMALQLEQTYSKKQILGLYLSRVYFGEGAYGLEAAAQRYFNKPASRLTVREAAMLAAVLKAPSTYSPVDQPEKSAERTALVLDAMVEIGAITAADRAKALAEVPRVWKTSPTAPAQYFVDWIEAQTRSKIGVPRSDLIVETTLDLRLERDASEVVQGAVKAHRKQGVRQAAVVTLDGSGAVRALIGGTDYTESPFDRAVDAHRQAGSAWKPFVYLTALETGRSPDDPVVDEPVTISGWSPSNYEPGHLGPITLEIALAKSINTIAAKLADEVGRPNIATLAHRVGIVSTVNTDPAMALGTTLVTPLEMAQAYTTFANGGNRVNAYGLLRIRSVAGSVIYARPAIAGIPAAGNPALSQLNRMLRAVITSGTGTRAALKGYDLAGKTGTTSDYKDAWFAGFTGQAATVVWVGRDDARPMVRITGGSVPAEIWKGVMGVALRRIPVTAIPYGPPPAMPLPAAEPVPADPVNPPTEPETQTLPPETPSSDATPSPPT
ncbi:MAG: penicillin-binding protein [Phenylobacterium zucineum]|nr:MAG: penicillin-binding protein [Phenylobacterium zucineum]